MGGQPGRDAAWRCVASKHDGSRWVSVSKHTQLSPCRSTRGPMSKTHGAAGVETHRVVLVVCRSTSGIEAHRVAPEPSAIGAVVHRRRRRDGVAASLLQCCNCQPAWPHHCPHQYPHHCFKYQASPGRVPWPLPCPGQPWPSALALPCPGQPWPSALALALPWSALAECPGPALPWSALVQTKGRGVTSPALHSPHKEKAGESPPRPCALA
jgi:hypothetical protein